MSEGQKVISNADSIVRGNLEVSEGFVESLKNGLTAGTTQTQAGAVVAGSGGLVVVATCANANDGVLLPLPSYAGQRMEVINEGAQNLKIWPTSTGTMNGGSADAVDATVLATTKARRYYATSALDWQKILTE